MVNRLIIPTLSGFKDMLRTMVSEESSLMALFNPNDDEYVLNGRVMYHRGEGLSEAEILNMVANTDINHPIQEPVLVYALFSFLYSQRDLRNNMEFETSMNELSTFMGVSKGAKGFQLVQKLEAFSNIYGVISGVGVFSLLEIYHQQGKLFLTAHYLHLALNMMLVESLNRYGERGIYYTDKVHANLVTERNKTAALIVIELTRLVVTAGKNGKPRIALRGLIHSIPQLYAIWSNKNGTSFRNKQLKRAFCSVDKLMKQKTELSEKFNTLEIDIPRLQVSKPKAVIHVRHNGCEDKKKGANKQWRKNKWKKS